jgi:hypothetical protein
MVGLWMLSCVGAKVVCCNARTEPAKSGSINRAVFIHDAHHGYAVAPVLCSIAESKAQTAWRL